MDKNVKTALIIGGIIIALVIVVPLVFGTVFGWHDSGLGMMGSGMWGGWMFLMPILFILFWGLVIWGIVALVRGLSQPGGSDSASNRSDSALEVLKMRYARGEIDKNEYEEKKRDLA
ncbi:SHOCT domain-containing protein [Chloroflexota bacterium]